MAGQYLTRNKFQIARQVECVEATTMGKINLSQILRNVNMSFFQATYRYTHPGGAWTPMGDMTGDRHSHGCGTFKDAGGILYLIVVGGKIGSNNFLDTAEKYDFAANSWV